MSRAERFRELLALGTVVAPGVFDGLTARLAEAAGFDVLYLTGAGISYSLLGSPDLGLASYGEVLDRLEHVTEASNLPVVADADTGYGGVLNVRRTVRAFERAGAAAIQIEDQAWPKRCGHLVGKEIVAFQESVARVRAAVDARDEMLVIARTDALSVGGMEAALERARAFREVGADIVFVESPRSREQLGLIRRELTGPLVANMVEGGRTPLLSREELATLGYDLILFPNSITRLIARVALDGYQELRRSGSSERLLENMLMFSELNEILGLDELTAVESSYAPVGAASEETDR